MAFRALTNTGQPAAVQALDGGDIVPDAGKEIHEDKPAVRAQHSGRAQDWKHECLWATPPRVVQIPLAVQTSLVVYIFNP